MIVHDHDGNRVAANGFTEEFADPNLGDTHTAWIEWGESITPGTVNGFNVSGSHAYVAAGTYTIYAYTGPYQNLAPAETWEGSIEVDTFEPSLAEVYVSDTFEVTCGPATKEECKLGGWTTSGYKNQGQCVSARVPE